MAKYAGMSKKYEIVYADPPWSFYNDKSVNVDCTTVKGMRRPPYPVLSIKDICSIPVKNITADNAILYQYNMSEESIFIPVVLGIMISFATVWLEEYLEYLDRKNAKRKDKHNDNVRNEGQGER